LGGRRRIARPVRKKYPVRPERERVIGRSSRRDYRHATAERCEITKDVVLDSEVIGDDVEWLALARLGDETGERIESLGHRRAVGAQTLDFGRPDVAIAAGHLIDKVAAEHLGRLPRLGHQALFIKIR